MTSNEYTGEPDSKNSSVRSAIEPCASHIAAWDRVLKTLGKRGVGGTGYINRARVTLATLQDTVKQRVLPVCDLCLGQLVILGSHLSGLKGMNSLQ
jgi:hypothetical protein